MKKAQLIGVSVALGAGLMAFVVAKNFMKPTQVQQIVQQDKVDATQVLVARTEISLGQVANESSFRWQD